MLNPLNKMFLDRISHALWELRQREHLKAQSFIIIETTFMFRNGVLWLSWNVDQVCRRGQRRRVSNARVSGEHEERRELDLRKSQTQKGLLQTSC